MVGHKKTVVEADFEADVEAKQLAAFVENVKKADTVREKYQGNFVAIFGQRVIEHDAEYNTLLSRISKYLNEKELYVGYIPKKHEILVV